MQTTQNTKIAYLGKFNHLHDEEYIARSFEMLGCVVKRIPQNTTWYDTQQSLLAFKPDILIYAKWECPKELEPTLTILKRGGMKTVCWLFDLYFNYSREYQVKNKSFFKSDYVFTTDGGNQRRFDEIGINHKCVRQGIYKLECKILPFKKIEHEIVFVGSDSPVYPERSALVKELKAEWFGKKDTNEMRGNSLNELYQVSRIVIGDSYPSAHYWSNRIVETLGRGGFLIHKEVEGLKEEYPYLVTYKDKKDLLEKIEYYKTHEKERRSIILKNFEWVSNKYTMEKQCKLLLSYIS